MDKIFSNLPQNLACMINYENINEITLRANKKVVVKVCNRHLFVDYVTAQYELEEVLKRFCDLSVYAYLDELKKGFITIDGGHRIGVCGTAVIKENDIYNIKNINSLNIRVAHEVKGCSDRLNYISGNLLVISPPGCGKTTMIRDLCRSVGKSSKVSVVDERGEIAGIHKGISCFDIGDMTDVLSLAPKSVGIEYVLRSMSPDYIVTDEISSSDSSELKRALSYGVYVIATAHGSDIDNTLSRIGLSKDFFKRIILLSNKNGIGTIEEDYIND